MLKKPVARRAASEVEGDHMCGIAGIIDLAEQRTVPDEVVRRMARAIVHRGPDEEGFFFRPGRRAGVAPAEHRRPRGWPAAGDQRGRKRRRGLQRRAVRPSRKAGGAGSARASPGEALRHGDHPAPLGGASAGNVRAAARAVCHRAVGRTASGACCSGATASASARSTGRGRATGCSSRPRSRRCSPRAWCRRGPTGAGIDHVFTFSALPGPITCFEGVQLLRAGHFLEITPAANAAEAEIAERAYWEMDFPGSRRRRARRRSAQAGR